MELLRRTFIANGLLDETGNAGLVAVSRLTPGTNVLAYCVGLGWLLHRWAGAVAAVVAASLPASLIVCVLTVALVRIQDYPVVRMLLAIGVLVATLLVFSSAASLLRAIRSPAGSGPRLDHRDRRRRDDPGRRNAGAHPARVSSAWCSHRRIGSPVGRGMSAIVVYLLLVKAIATSFAGMGSLPQIQQDFVETRRAISAEQLSQSVLVGRSTPGPIGAYVVAVGLSRGGVARRSRRVAGHADAGTRSHSLLGLISAGSISHACGPLSMPS